jgi:hypothetical protein
MDTRRGKPTAGESRNTSLRATVRALVTQQYDGNQRAAAAAIGITPSSLNDFINGRSGAGQKLCDGLVTVLRRGIEDIVAANGDLTALESSRPISAPAVEVTFGKLPNWPHLLEGARAIDPAVPERVWNELANVRVFLSATPTASMVADAARFLLRHAPPA